MKDLKVKRKTLTPNVANKFEFDVKGFEFEVKNFSDFDIYVAFKEITDTDKMLKIPAWCCENCLINKEGAYENFSNEVYIISEGSGEVEVQCLKF